MFSLFWLSHYLSFANILFAVIGLLAGKYLVHITRVPGAILSPIVMTFSVLGSYALRNNLFDVGLAIVFGFVGYFMERWRYPAAPLVIALILGPMLEVNFRRSMQISGWDMSAFFTRPLSLVLWGLAAVALLYPLWQRLKAKGIS